MSPAVQPKSAYEPPRIVVLGSVHEMTQGTNKGTRSDGVFVHTIS